MRSKVKRQRTNKSTDNLGANKYIITRHRGTGRKLNIQKRDAINCETDERIFTCIFIKKKYFRLGIYKKVNES